MKYFGRITRIALFILTFAIGNSVFAQTLWQNTKYGMTLEQVKTAYPNAVPVTKENSAQDGSKELLKINEVKISDEPFSVSFFFKDNKLTRVYLSPNKEFNKSAGERVFNSLNRSLTAKYGQPINSKDEKGIFISKNSTWVSEGADIFLSMMIIGDKPILYLLYHIETAADAENL